MSWHLFKEQISRLSGIDAACLHIHVGLLLFLVFAVIFQHSPHRWLLALAAVAGVELGNEAIDVLDWLTGITRANWKNGVLDIVNTLFWPTVLTLLLRARLL